MKKIVIILFSLVFVISGITAVFADNGQIFTDVPNNSWFYSAVVETYNLGLINGKGNDLFCPDDDMTFAEAIKLAACMNQKYLEEEVTLVNGDKNWYTTFLEYCKEKGMFNETEGSDFMTYSTIVENIYKKITRFEYVYLFARALPKEAYEEINTISENLIPDLKCKGETGEQEVYAMYRAGILNGVDNKGNFNPNRTIARREVATVVQRIMNPNYRNIFEITTDGVNKNEDNYLALKAKLTKNYCCAVAFIGYNGIGENLDAFFNINEFKKMYPFVSKLSKENIAIQEGDEYYCFVFGDDVKKVVVNKWIIDESNDFKGSVGEQLYASDNNDPIIVKCNLGDMPNTVVRITKADGSIFEYNPSMSLKDGRLVKPETAPYVFDFTFYKN